MLEKLTEQEKELITLRYGKDLLTPTAGKLTKEQTNKFYGVLIPKMKRLLSNPNKERKSKEKRPTIPVKNSTSKTQNVETMTKDDYIKILELFKTPSFTKLMAMYSPKEAMIVSLKLGYIDGKYFSTSAISKFLGIEPQEVIDTTKKYYLYTEKKLIKLWMKLYKL